MCIREDCIIVVLFILAGTKAFLYIYSGEMHVY